MPNRPSAAQNFFNEIKAHEGFEDPASFLKSLVNSRPPTEETEYREFKGANDLTPGPNSPTELREGRINEFFCEALSGFANTSGGVFVWGIDARKPQGSLIEQACGFNLVQNPEVFKARLKQFLLNAVDPPVPGVEIEAFPDSTQGGKGFVVCYIPESEYKPHRANIGKRWVMRVGDNFVDIPPAVLRSLFFPNRNAYAVLKIKSTPQEYGLGVLRRGSFLRLNLQLFNKGPATLQNGIVTVAIGTLQPSGWHPMQSGHHRCALLLIHPGHTEDLPMMEIDLNSCSQLMIEARQGKLVLIFHVFAYDLPPFKFKVEIEEEETRGESNKVVLPQPLEMEF